MREDLKESNEKRISVLGTFERFGKVVSKSYGRTRNTILLKEGV